MSRAGTTLAGDLVVAAGPDEQMPAITVLSRDDSGRLRHSYTAQAMLGEQGRGIDALGPVWNVFHLTPSGRPDW